MDHYFPRFDKAAELTELPRDLALLMVGIAARQAASPTAAQSVRVERAQPSHTLFAPTDGAFNGSVADAIWRWRDE